MPIYGLFFFVALGLSGDVVEPRTMPYEDYLRLGFDVQWRLPEHPDRGIDLVAEMRSLATSDWFGDMVSEARKDGVDVALKRVREEPPALVAPRVVRTWLPKLLRDRGLQGSDWDPDSESDDDGILFVDAWSLAESTLAPWRHLEGSKRIQQGATLIYGNLDVIKTVENDYHPYLAHVGSSYESIRPVERSYVRSKEDATDPYAGLWIQFRSDLPFPFSGYECQLRILNRLDADGNLVTDVYSPSKDFYWMAGRDVFYPVRSSKGGWVATLMVRQLGFDVRDVPDGDDDRRAAIRGGIGNLKLRSERAFRSLETREESPVGVIPRFVVRGAGG